MLIDRTHKRWFVGSTLLVAIAAAAHVGISMQSIHGATGGSVLGLLFGLLGSACMIFAALLAVRRRLPTWRIGSAQFWLRGHLWLGTLGFVLILFHSGFGWGGLLENLLWVSFGLVVVTGFLGVGFQQTIPRLLASEVPLETMVSQIPTLSHMSVFKADKIVAERVGIMELDFEPHKKAVELRDRAPYAYSVLKRQEQSIGERPEDFPRALAKIYANVPQPESEKKKPPAKEPSPSAATEPPAANIEATPASSASAAPAAKPKSPMELMKEKAAAKAAGDATPKPLATPDAAAPVTEKKLSPLEQMKAKKAALAAASPDAAAPAPEKKLSPIEQMQAKKAALAAASPDAAAPAPEKKLSPIEQMKAKKAALAAASPDAAAPADEKKLSSPEQMSDKPAAPPEESPKPVDPMKQLISISCAQCGTVFTVARRHEGKQGRCTNQECKAPYIVPKHVDMPVVPVVTVPAEPISAAPAMPVVAAPASNAPAAGVKLSPMEQMRARKAAAAASTPPSSEPNAKPLSPMEQVRAKLSTATKSPAEQPRPLTVEKSPVVKQPVAEAQPTAEKSAATAPAKPKPKAAAPIPPALLEELKDFHIKIVRPFLIDGKSKQHRMDDVATARRLFAQLRSDLPTELHESVQQLEELCEERRQFNTQLRLHHWLHWWLIVHIPSSIALLVLFVVHVIVSLRVVPFGR